MWRGCGREHQSVPLLFASRCVWTESTSLASIFGFSMGKGRNRRPRVRRGEGKEERRIREGREYEGKRFVVDVPGGEGMRAAEHSRSLASHDYTLSHSPN